METLIRVLSTPAVSKISLRYYNVFIKSDLQITVGPGD